MTDDDTAVLNGMDPRAMATFIATQQTLLYRLIDEHKKQEAVVEQKRIEYEQAFDTAEYTRSEIAVVLTFLETYNSVAHDDWFAAVGYDRYTQPIKAEY